MLSRTASASGCIRGSTPAIAPKVAGIENTVDPKGKMITRVRPMTREEALELDWTVPHHARRPMPVVLELSNGDQIVVGADSECNGPGWLFEMGKYDGFWSVCPRDMAA